MASPSKGVVMTVRVEDVVGVNRASVHRELRDSYGDILVPGALELLAKLHRRFEPRRQELLEARRERQACTDLGALPDFRVDTHALRADDWQVAPLPEPLLCRHAEITGPVDRKVVINGLNSGARVFMADFEDSTTPRIDLMLDGQANLRDAVAGTIDYTAPNGKYYRVDDDPAVLMVRPRGWHLPERHVTVGGAAMAGALVDCGLFAFHNACILHERGLGPFLYLPKLESMEEAALWDAVLVYVERVLGLPVGAIKVTVLIETLPAMLQMDEILYALRGRIVAPNCGRWDYISSYLTTFRGHAARLLPERNQ